MKYKYLVPMASFLPDLILRLLGKIFPKAGYDQDDGWTFWLDASYWAWCRKDKRKTANGTNR